MEKKLLLLFEWFQLLATVSIFFRLVFHNHRMPRFTLLNWFSSCNIFIMLCFLFFLFSVKTLVPCLMDNQDSTVFYLVHLNRKWYKNFMILIILDISTVWYGKNDYSQKATICNMFCPFRTKELSSFKLICINSKETNIQGNSFLSNKKLYNIRIWNEINFFDKKKFVKSQRLRYIILHITLGNSNVSVDTNQTNLHSTSCDLVENVIKSERVTYSNKL